MADSTITYTSTGGIWTFYFPTVTCTRAVVTSGWGAYRISTKFLYTIRAILIAVDEADLELQKKKARDVLEAVGGEFLWNKNSTDVVKHNRTTDMNFGPHPVSVSFDKYFATNSVMITWQLETEESRVDSEISEWAYSVTHSVNKNLYTTRTISGLLRLNATKFTPGQAFGGADAYRATVDAWICACPTDWQRIQQDFDTSPDGLTLTFHIVDEQQYAVLPANVSDGGASLSVAGNPRLGGRRDFILEGWYESVPDEPYAAREGFVALASNLFNYSIDDEAFRVKHLALHQDLYKPRLAFTMVWDAFPPKAGVPGGTDTEKMSNWMLALMTKADNWLNTYKTALATARGPYGTTQVLGHCGNASVAPVVDLQDFFIDQARTGPGGSSADTAISSQSLGTYDQTPELYYEYHQSFSYSIDENIVVIPYKDPDKDDEDQKIFATQVYVKVCGHISSHGEPPKLPPPPYKPTDATLLRRKLVTEEPKAGPEYTVRWMYLMKLKSHAVPNHIKFGFSPFVTDTNHEIFNSSDDPENTTVPNKEYTLTSFTNDFSPPATPP